MHLVVVYQAAVAWLYSRPESPAAAHLNSSRTGTKRHDIYDKPNLGVSGFIRFVSVIAKHSPPVSRWLPASLVPAVVLRQPARRWFVTAAGGGWWVPPRGVACSGERRAAASGVAAAATARRMEGYGETEKEYTATKTRRRGPGIPSPRPGAVRDRQSQTEFGAVRLVRDSLVPKSMFS